MAVYIFTESSFSNPPFLAFMAKWENDIEQMFPDFSLEDSSFGDLILTYNAEKIIGVFIFQSKGDELHIDLDYVPPSYRDMGIGNHFFDSKIGGFKNAGFKTVVALTVDSDQKIYLEKLNFLPSKKHEGYYELNI